ncbi:glycosyl transferase [uncultured Bilophila sp.]|uniref:glycosyl transferase n=1 Tax=uncultured Bilophila sp. TaxID=529385 RepID=UPI00280AB51D|nr:glycosyl transferase [uncultured Bilophila sp.]
MFITPKKWLRASRSRTPRKISPPLHAPHAAPPPQDEIRCYRFSPVAVRCEKALLEEQEAADLRELLANASLSINAFTTLMELMDAEAKVDGVVIHILARELKRIDNMLFKLQDAYSTVEPVEAYAG